MSQTPNSLNRKKIAQRNVKENKAKQYPLLNLYILIIAIIQIIGQAARIFILKMLKPIPMILMIIYISNKNSHRDHLVPIIIRAGLILSLIGDLFMMIDEMSAFMIATVFFLIAHILYCVAFGIGQRVRPASRTNRLVRVAIYIGLIILCISNVFTLWDVMPNRPLFTAYSFVLCGMVIFSVKRYEITTPYSYSFTIAGAILFSLSDNLLGMLKFNGITTSLGRAMVMLLYYGGQYFIMHGALHHSNLQNELDKFFKNSNTSTTVPVLTIGKSNPKHLSRQWDHGNGSENEINLNTAPQTKVQ